MGHTPSKKPETKKAPENVTPVVREKLVFLSRGRILQITFGPDILAQYTPDSTVLVDRAFLRPGESAPFSRKSSVMLITREESYIAPMGQRVTDAELQLPVSVRPDSGHPAPDESEAEDEVPEMWDDDGEEIVSSADPWDFV